MLILMKKLMPLLLMIFIMDKLFSQTIIYQQNFDNPATALNGFRLANLDMGNPSSPNYASLADSAWVIREYADTDNSIAIGTSDYDEPVAANDWLITPAIRLGKASRLSWKSVSINANTDSYEVYISTSEQSVNGCLLNFPVLTVNNEVFGEWQEHELSLTDLGYAEQTVYIGFRLITLNGLALGLDDIRVADDSISEIISLTFTVNMKKYIDKKDFNPRTDTVDVAGNFNNWIGEKNILSLVADTDSSVYSTTIPGFYTGSKLEFKFRINSSWNDTSVEFPYGGSNRLWEISEEKYTYTAYYNESGTISSMDNEVPATPEITIYPNPVLDRIQIRFPMGVNRIRMVSSDGRNIMDWTVSGTSFSSPVDVIPGLYHLLFYDSNRMVGSKKIIKH